MQNIANTGKPKSEGGKKINLRKSLVDCSAPKSLKGSHSKTWGIAPRENDPNGDTPSLKGWHDDIQLNNIEYEWKPERGRKINPCKAPANRFTPKSLKGLHSKTWGNAPRERT